MFANETHNHCELESVKFDKWIDMLKYLVSIISYW
jgi:hypothetical protein